MHILEYRCMCFAEVYFMHDSYKPYLEQNGHNLLSCACVSFVTQCITFSTDLPMFSSHSQCKPDPTASQAFSTSPKQKHALMLRMQTIEHIANHISKLQSIFLQQTHLFQNPIRLFFLGGGFVRILFWTYVFGKCSKMSTNRKCIFICFGFFLKKGRTAACPERKQSEKNKGKTYKQPL